MTPELIVVLAVGTAVLSLAAWLPVAISQARKIRRLRRERATLAVDNARLRRECACAHAHYAEAVHREWWEKSRADGHDPDAARAAARAAGLAAMGTSTVQAVA